jgi:hypothetical protein
LILFPHWARKSKHSVHSIHLSTHRGERDRVRGIRVNYLIAKTNWANIPLYRIEKEHG